MYDAIKILSEGRGIASAEPATVIAETAPIFRPTVAGAYEAYQVCNLRCFAGVLPIPRIEVKRIQPWGEFSTIYEAGRGILLLISINDLLVASSPYDARIVRDVVWHEAIHAKVFTENHIEAWRHGHGGRFQNIADRISLAEGWLRSGAQRAPRASECPRKLRAANWPHAHKAAIDPEYKDYLYLVACNYRKLLAEKQREDLDLRAQLSPRIRARLSDLGRRLFDAGDVESADLVYALWAEFETEKKELSVSVSGLCGVRRQAGEEISQSGGLHVPGMVDEFSI